MAESSRLIPRENLVAFILLTSCFAWWGLANNMTDTLLAAFKRIMSMTDARTAWIQSAFYGSYFCLALPGAIFIKKYSYKAGVLLGLGMFVAGSLLMYPASLTMNYFHFLGALYILAGGLSVLETTANPYIIAMGPTESGTQRLNFAQSFNPIGSISGVLLSKWFILSNLNQASAEERAAMSAAELEKVQAAELSAVMGPYVAVAFVLVAIWLAFAFMKMPEGSDAGDKSSLGTTIGRLIKIRHYRWGVIAQFFYVGAQIAVWSFTIRYVMQELSVNEEQAASYYLAALIVFTAARFVCTGLMKYVDPGKLLASLAGLAILCCAATIYGSGYVGVYALIAISMCMSLMFPTIFAMAVHDLGDDTKIGGSGVIMAILGGAVITQIQGWVSDSTGSIHMAYWVPLLCFVVIAFHGLVTCRPADESAS